MRSKSHNNREFTSLKVKRGKGGESGRRRKVKHAKENGSSGELSEGEKKHQKGFPPTSGREGAGRGSRK